jgi:hypothetical protein
MSAANNYALSLLTESPYLRISNGGVQAAVVTIATYLTTLRSQGTATSCVSMLRDLIDDILRGQIGNTNEMVQGSAAVAENLIVDGPTSTAFGTIRTYLNGLALTNVPPVGALPSKQAFTPLCRLIVEAT